MHLLKAVTLMGEVPTVSNKMTHKGFLAAFQVSMLLMKFCIDGTPADFDSLVKMTICHVSK